MTSSITTSYYTTRVTSSRVIITSIGCTITSRVYTTRYSIINTISYSIITMTITIGVNSISINISDITDNSTKNGGREIN